MKNFKEFINESMFYITINKMREFVDFYGKDEEPTESTDGDLGHPFYFLWNVYKDKIPYPYIIKEFEFYKDKPEKLYDIISEYILNNSSLIQELDNYIGDWIEYNFPEGHHASNI